MTKLGINVNGVEELTRCGTVIIMIRKPVRYIPNEMTILEKWKP